MSKSLGNFLSLVEAVELFSADATRLALASAGDSLEDANFERAQATACVKALTDELEWITAHLAPSAGLRTGEMAFADRVVLNDISKAMVDVQEAYETMRYSVAVRDAFYGMRSLRDLYARLCAATGEFILLFTADISCESCSHFDSIPRTSSTFRSRQATPSTRRASRRTFSRSWPRSHRSALTLRSTAGARRPC